MENTEIYDCQNTSDSILHALTLLVYLRYLAYRVKDRIISIPNEEFRQEFLRAVTMGKHKEIANLILTSDHLLQETLQQNGDAVAKAIAQIRSRN